MMVAAKEKVAREYSGGENQRTIVLLDGLVPLSPIPITVLTTAIPRIAEGGGLKAVSKNHQATLSPKTVS